MPQEIELISMDNALYVVECGCTNDWLTRQDCSTGKPMTLVDLNIDEDKCDICNLNKWVVLPLTHSTVVELEKIQDEIVLLFQCIAMPEEEEEVLHA